LVVVPARQPRRDVEGRGGNWWKGEGIMRKGRGGGGANIERKMAMKEGKKDCPSPLLVWHS
jgi:hypothetical protein